MSLGRRELIRMAAGWELLPGAVRHHSQVVERFDTVVIGKAAHALERLAAEELTRFAAAMTGRTPRVVTDEAFSVGSEHHGPMFLVGTVATNDFLGRIAASGIIKCPAAQSEKTAQAFQLKALTWEGQPCLAMCGRSSLAAMYAVYHYLEKHCEAGFFVDQVRNPVLGGLPFGGLDEYIEPHFEHRGYMVHPNWTRPYVHCCRLWSFKDWRQLIDWMRRKRLNRLVVFHDEGTYMWGDAILRAFPELRPDSRTLEKFVVHPEYRTELNRRVFRYARDNGVSIVFNLMYSQVPDFFREAHPELSYHQLQMENAGICAMQPACREIMRRFWGKILEIYGIDESHIYVVCPYQHEIERCPHFPTSAPVALQAWQVLRELDPQAEVYAESWCWGRYWLKRDKPREWQDFLRLTPAEMGVADLDRKYTATPERETLFRWYRPRPWLAMRLLSFETGYPPSLLESTPEEVIEDVRAAAAHGALGLIAFNIVANSNELLSDLAADLGWSPYQDAEAYLAGYVRRRFGPASLPVMLESQRLQVLAADLALRLVGGDTCFPAETELYRKAQGGEKGLDAWIEERLERFRRKHRLASRSRELALAAAGTERGDTRFLHYLWESAYTVARWEGCIEFYEAYRSGRDRRTSNKHFQTALKRFLDVKALFADRPQYSMEKLQKLAPDVPYLRHFLQGWDSIRRRWVDIRPYYYVVWEHFDRYERILRRMDPLQLGEGAHEDHRR